MQLQLPHPPRKVRLGQIPGAWLRVGLAALGALVLLAVIGALCLTLYRRADRDLSFVAKAQEVEGTVSDVRLAKKGREVASFDVLYDFAGLRRAGSAVETFPDYAATLSRGSKVKLLLDGGDPDAPRDAAYAREKARQWDFAPYTVAVAIAAALVLAVWMVARAAKAELDPIRTGLIVWLTVEGQLPERGDRPVVRGSYYREDVKKDVRARIRPGRALVRNGDKVLAAVAPGRPNGALVVDEDLARALGWFG